MRLYNYMLSSSTDGKGLFFDGPITEIKFMMKHESMVAEFVPFNSNPAEFRFELSGLAEAIKAPREACKC